MMEPKAHSDFSRPPMSLAHESLDAWAREVNVESRLPRVGEWSVWWRLRFLLVHEVLPRLMAGQTAARQPDSDWKRAAARVAKGVIGHRRLQRAYSLPITKPRVLVISRANAWDGRRDREMQSAIDALEAAGIECLIMEQSHGPLAAQMEGWRTRPGNHLIGDFVHLYYRLSRKPSFAAPTGDAPAPVVIGGWDYSCEVWDFIQRSAVHHAHEHNAYLTVMPEVMRRLGISALLLTDENGAGHGMKMAAVSAKISVVAVQHGCIHKDHMSYMFPRNTQASSIPVPDKTCVYGEHERDMLAQTSCYNAAGVVVTGQVQNDARGLGLRPWGERGESARRLREATLPTGKKYLLLLTSQDLYHELAAISLLGALREAGDDWYVVVRPHPREAPAHWPQYIRELAVRDRATVATSGSLDEWLDACDAHASVSSTVLSEAVLWGRPNVVLGMATVGDWLGVVNAGLATMLDINDNLDAVLAPWVKMPPERVAEMERKREAYVSRHFYNLDGKAGERVAQLVRAMIT